MTQRIKCGYCGGDFVYLTGAVVMTTNKSVYTDHYGTETKNRLQKPMVGIRFHCSTCEHDTLQYFKTDKGITSSTITRTKNTVIFDREL